MTHLDTSFLVDLLREQQAGRRGPARTLLDALADQPLAASVFVACELEAGAARARRPADERGRVSLLLEALPIVYPDGRFAAAYGDLLARILGSGGSVATMDLLIATSAVLENAVLVTRNRRDFERIPGLRLVGY